MTKKQSKIFCRLIISFDNRKVIIIMKYLYETHFHTSEVSPCGNVSAADGVQMYKDAGYSGLMVTDHFSTSYLTERYKASTWKDGIDYFLRGYYEAKRYEKIDFSVMLGLEARFDQNMNDYLIFGADEKFLYENEWFTKLSLKQFKKLAEKNSLTIIQAHPFRVGMTVTEPRYIDGIEVFNGNRRHDSANPIAAAWAERYGLIVSSGSDFHENEDLARGGIYTDVEARDSKDLRKIILSGNYTVKKH